MTKADRAKMKALDDSHKSLIKRWNDTTAQWQRAWQVADWLHKEAARQEAELQTSFDTIQEI